MSDNSPLNSALVARSFSKGVFFDDYTDTKYPCQNIVEISNYVLSLRSDKRAVSTGIDATNYSPFQTLRTSNSVQIFARSIGLVVELAVELAKPSSVLINQSILNTHLVLMLHRHMNSEINVINGPYLHLYEKFCKDDAGLSSVPYSCFDKYQIMDGIEKTFDMIIAYADDLEGDTDYVSALMDSVTVGGVMLISNSANQGMVYSSSDFDATPQAELHDFINADARFTSYHIPLFLGFSFIKRIN
jgi:hypothetical protein